MKEFPTLRQFCLLKDPTDREPKRDLWVNSLGGHLQETKRRGWANGRDVVARYDLAKEAWDQFGDDGPPVGTKVMMLSYHGGIATTTGVFEEDKRFILVKYNNEEAQGLVYRDYWWAWMIPADCAYVTGYRPWLRWEHVT